jgi:hypothetical protein
MDDEVGRLGQPVEVEREVVRWEDLAERHGRGVAVHRRHPPVVNPELLERLVAVVAERVTAGAGDDGCGAAEAGGGYGDVGGGAAEELPEGLHLRERYAGLQGVDVHPDAPHGDDVEWHATLASLRARCRNYPRVSPARTPVNSLSLHIDVRI